MANNELGFHLGIIPDGSRRWARANGISNYDGGRSGEVMEEVIRHLFEKHPEVNILSIYALSTENLGRAKTDTRLVYNLLIRNMKKLLQQVRTSHENVKVNVVGSRWGEIPLEIKEVGDAIVSETKNNTGRILNICIGYGGREEIFNAVMLSSKLLRKNPLINKLHENIFERFLLIPQPLDIMIRTGGEKRLSGFMLYQIEYAELFFTDTLWPDFTTQELDEIIQEFTLRNRRFGK
jgi:undecaprenyl diphosphate synthase